jgi:hypothetical protein
MLAGHGRPPSDFTGVPKEECAEEAIPRVNPGIYETQIA